MYTQLRMKQKIILGAVLFFLVGIVFDKLVLNTKPVVVPTQNSSTTQVASTQAWQTYLFPKLNMSFMLPPDWTLRTEPTIDKVEIYLDKDGTVNSPELLMGPKSIIDHVNLADSSTIGTLKDVFYCFGGANGIIDPVGSGTPITVGGKKALIVSSDNYMLSKQVIVFLDSENTYGLVCDVRGTAMKDTFDQFLTTFKFNVF